MNSVSQMNCRSYRRIASHILYCSWYSWLFIKTMDRHNREYLVIAQASGKDWNNENYRNTCRTVFLISVWVPEEHASWNLLSETPGGQLTKKTFNLCPGLKLNKSQAESVKSFFPNLLGIVPGFNHPWLIYIIPESIKLSDELMIIFIYEPLRHPMMAKLQSQVLSNINTEWWAVRERPDSVITFGWGIIVFITCVHQMYWPSRSHISAKNSLRCFRCLMSRYHHNQLPVLLDIDELYIKAKLAKLNIELWSFAQCIFIVWSL